MIVLYFVDVQSVKRNKEYVIMIVFYFVNAQQAQSNG